MRKLLSTLSSTLQGGVRGGLLFLALVATTCLWAHDFNVGGIYYNYLNGPGNEVEVTYRGNEYNSYEEYSGAVSIPSTVRYDGTTYNVTSIGRYAFSNCYSLTSVTIPNSVTSIGYQAFYYCSDLTSITIPKSVTFIGSCAFGKCYSLYRMYVEEGNTIYDRRDNCNAIIETETNTLIAGCQNTTIPNSVTSIGDDAFHGCFFLSSITIPNSVTSIGDWAFYLCPLTSITIPNSVTSIGKYAFSDCSLLTSITIPNSVTSIGSGAFAGCSSLTTPVYNAHCFAYMPTSFKGAYVIPEGIKQIVGGAFNGCSSLTSVTIPNSVTSIGGDAFYYCSSLTSVTINSDAIVNKTYSYDDNIPDIFGSQVTEYIIGDDVKGIGDDAFSYCSSLTSITIPNSVTSIGSGAFAGCSSLTSVTIPNSVKSIGFGVFSSCRSLTSITIPNSVTSIGDRAFLGCSSLTSVTIPNSVTSIGESAFRNCSSITSITIGNSVTSIGENAFSVCSGLTSLIWNAKNCTVPESTGEYHLFLWLEKGEDNVWRYVSPPVKFVIFGESVERIPKYLCMYMDSLTSITIPNSVTSIGSAAFNSCKSVRRITIGKGVTSIEVAALGGCQSLDTVVWSAINYPDFSSSSATPFAPAIASNLSSFSFGEDVEYIPAYLCSKMSKITSVNIPAKVTAIGNDAFYGCTSLNTINWNAKSCDDFYDHYTSPFASIESQIKKINFGDKVKNIPSYLCYNMSKLTSLDIPNSVNTIGECAFFNCNITSLIIPANVNKIRNDAFSYCSEIESIISFAETPPTLGRNAFNGVDYTIPVIVPCGSVADYLANDKWTYFKYIQEPVINYAISVKSQDEEMGTANIDQHSSCATQISATPKLGYYFKQWNDGNTDNPRIVQMSQDTTFTAEFAISYSGKCGDNLYWKYDDEARQLTISGFGEMYNYTTSTQPWVIFKRRFETLSLSDEITKIGEYAFDGCVRIREITLGSKMEELADYSFTKCSSLQDIYCYAQRPPFEDRFLFVDYHYQITVHVPCDYLTEYQMDYIWQNFPKYECISSNHVETDDVVVTPGTNDVTITWPTEDGVDTYTIVIKKDGEVVCTLTFNADGQLLNIAFAPGRNGNHPAQYAEAVANGKGFRFTVTGLEEGTDYTYDITVKDASNQTINSHTGAFTTQSTTAVENTHSQSPMTNCQKIFRNGQLIILRDGVEYNAMGQEIQ